MRENGGTWPPGESETARQVREFDWGTTSLGRIETWSERLRGAVELMLASPLVSSLVYGPERILIYNDAAARLYGARHPGVLGRPLREGFPDSFPAVAPLYDRVFAGEASAVPAQPLDVSGAGGEVFEAYLVPVREADGTVIGATMTGFEISQRLAAEAALRESAERFRAFVTASSDVVYRMSPDWAQMYRLDGQGFLFDMAKPSSDWMENYIDREDRPQVWATIREAIQSGSLFELEHRVRRADGTLGWTLSRAVPIHDEDGHIIEWIGAASNVTARRQVEEALRESEERFRQFSEASPDVIWVRDAHTLEWEYLSPGFAKVYGGDRAEALKSDSLQSWAEMILPEDRQEALESIARVWSSEQVTFDYRIRRPSDSQIRWLRNTVFPMLDRTGQVQRIGGIGQDITDLTAFETALRESERRQRALIEGMPQLVWRASRPGQWVWASQQWMEYTGQSIEDSLGLNWLEVIHPDDRAGALSAWRQAEIHEVFKAEYRLLHRKEGLYRWFQTRATPVYDETGRIVEWLGTSTDVDDLRRMQERQSVLVAELQHRTRNLITVVKGISQQTLRRSESLEAYRDHFTDRLEALSRVQGLLSRAEVEPITIDALVRMELEALGFDGEAERVTIDGPEVFLRSSVVQILALALHELATNARKHGVLAAESGHLQIQWQVRDLEGTARHLCLEWIEDGISRRQSARKQPGGGYGRELIERALPYQLDARTSYHLGERGLRCTIDLPLKRRD
ncbi:MAG: PAS domain-containing protein [Microvirga sp.]